MKEGEEELGNKFIGKIDDIQVVGAQKRLGTKSGSSRPLLVKLHFHKIKWKIIDKAKSIMQRDCFREIFVKLVLTRAEMNSFYIEKSLGKDAQKIKMSSLNEEQ